MLLTTWQRSVMSRHNVNFQPVKYWRFVTAVGACVFWATNHPSHHQQGRHLTINTNTGHFVLPADSTGCLLTGPERSLLLSPAVQRKQGPTCKNIAPQCYQNLNRVPLMFAVQALRLLSVPIKTSIKWIHWNRSIFNITSINAQTEYQSLSSNWLLWL